MVSEVANILEIVRVWTTPVALVATFGVVSRHYAVIRRANTADRGLTLEGETKALQLYADEVKALRVELRESGTAHRKEVSAIRETHRKDLEYMEERNAECDKDREDLKEKVEALRDVVRGYGRVIVNASAQGVVSLGDYPSEEIQRATQRVDALFSKKDK